MVYLVLLLSNLSNQAVLAGSTFQVSTPVYSVKLPTPSLPKSNLSVLIIDVTGLDIRERLVNRAKLWSEELNLCANVHFVTANATVAFKSLLATYPGPLTYVSILCPDPQFKRKHRKRRIVQKELVEAVIYYLKPGGGIFVQSDVKDVASEMRAEFDEHLGSSLQVAAGDGGADVSFVKYDSEGWAEENPLGVPSEREAHVQTNGGRVYRAVYSRI